MCLRVVEIYLKLSVAGDRRHSNYTGAADGDGVWLRPAMARVPEGFRGGHVGVWDVKLYVGSVLQNH